MRSAKMGSSLMYYFGPSVTIGIFLQILFLKFLNLKNFMKSFIIGIFELILWTATQGYILSAIYFKTPYEMEIHFQVHYVHEIFGFIFGIILLIECSKSKLIAGLASMYLLFSLTVGIEYFTKTNFGEYLRFLDPIPIILLILLFKTELKKFPNSYPEIIDDSGTMG